MSTILAGFVPLALAACFLMRNSILQDFLPLCCLGFIRLAEKYSAQRVEAAAERALLTGACRYKSVESILKNSLDQAPQPSSAPAPATPPHDNIRGPEYFE
jgi:hypothetical protein